MSRLNRSAEEWLHPTGTLFLDDLEELEQLLAPEGSGIDVEWTLRGRRELSSAKLEAESIQELAMQRNRVTDPESLELNAWESDSIERVLFSANLSTSEDKGSWVAQVSGSDGRAEHYDDSLIGIRNIFQRASQMTWAQKHKRWTGIIGSDWWFIAALVCAYAAWVGAASLAGDYPWLAAAVVIAYLGATAGGYWLRRRVEANAAWHPRKFDLRSVRTQAGVQAPPDVLGPNAIMIAVTIVAGVVGPVVAELAW